MIEVVYTTHCPPHPGLVRDSEVTVSEGWRKGGKRSKLNHFSPKQAGLYLAPCEHVIATSAEKNPQAIAMGTDTART